MEFISNKTEQAETASDKEETEESHIYNITADYKKSTYQTEHWRKQISNGKIVTLLVTTYFYWGTFEITLTDKEKEEILKKDSIILNDYDVSCEELDSGCDQFEEIENEESYNEEELNEIHQLIYRYENEEEKEEKEEKEEDENEDDEDKEEVDEEYNFDEDILQYNGWDMDDTIYGFDTGCELELISE